MIVLWLIAALPAILLALLAVPVDLAFNVHRHEGEQKGSVTFRWLFGLVRLRLGKPKQQRRPKPERRKAARRQRKQGSTRRLMAMLRIEGFGRRLLTLAKRLLRCIHIHDLRMVIRLGLDDPADTGCLWGAMGPLSAVLTLPETTRVSIEPEFTAETLEVDGQGSVRVIPIQLLFVLLVFVLSPSTLRALHAMKAGSP